MLNLDTHVLLHALAGNLNPEETRILSNHEWSISAIVLWEIAKLAQRGRIETDIESSEFTRAISPIQVWPIDLTIARAITRVDFRSDPADEIIAATSIVHEIPLLTRDRVILGSKVVPLAKLR